MITRSYSSGVIFPDACAEEPSFLLFMAASPFEI
jgi:hypothetical protein